MSRHYRLTAPDGSIYLSDIPGALGGNSRSRIYGRLDCASARGALPKGYARHRVFFADEAAAIGAGYRPCGTCMPARYREWKSRHVEISSE
jgi:methylphosphotriester-DNA--protein-cysteine methyltransferase